jgi:hypothetical protein
MNEQHKTKCYVLPKGRRHRRTESSSFVFQRQEGGHVTNLVFLASLSHKNLCQIALRLNIYRTFPKSNLCQSPTSRRFVAFSEKIYDGEPIRTVFSNIGEDEMWMRSSRVWVRSSRVVRASDSQCRSRNCPGFDPSILRHSEWNLRGGR